MKKLIEAIFHTSAAKQPTLLRKHTESIANISFEQFISSYGDTLVCAKREYNQIIEEKEKLLEQNLTYPQIFDGIKNLYLARETECKVKEIFNGVIPNISAYSDYIQSPFTGLLSKKKIDLLIKAIYMKTFNFVHDSRIFISPKDFSSHLHFDWKSRTNVFFQFAGKKEVTLYHPEHSESLGGRLNLGTSSSRAKPSLSVILEPGDILIFPPFFWHTTRSLEPSISISLRVLSDLKIDGQLSKSIPDWRQAQAYSRGIKDFNFPSISALSSLRLELITKELEKVISADPRNYSKAENALRLEYLHMASIRAKLPFKL